MLVVIGYGEVVDLSDVECTCTLGSVALSVGVTMGAVVGTFNGAFNLGDGVCGFRSLSALLSVSAIVFIALRVVSPTSKLGAAVEGGAIRIVIMSVATCLKRSSKPTF